MMITLQVAYLLCLATVAICIPDLPVRTKYDAMLDKVVAHIKANGHAFDGLVSFTSDTPLFGKHTEFTKFSVNNTSVRGYEKARRSDYTQGKELSNNIVEFSGSILAHLVIPGTINFEAMITSDGEKRNYSGPFVAQPIAATDDMDITIQYNKTTKSAQVIKLTHNYDPIAKFWIQSDCFSSDRRTYFGVFTCEDMKDVTEERVFSPTKDIRKTWDEKLKKLIESTVF